MALNHVPSVRAVDSYIRNSLVPEMVRDFLPQKGHPLGAATKDSKDQQDTTPRQRTDYVVLQQVSLTGADGETVPALVSIGTAPGLNDVDAIKAATGKAEIESGVFIAVPARSYRPRTISVKTTRTLSVS